MPSVRHASALTLIIGVIPARMSHVHAAVLMCSSLELSTGTLKQLLHAGVPHGGVLTVVRMPANHRLGGWQARAL